MPAGIVCRILGTGLVLVLGSLSAGAAALEPARLRCENLVDPPAIDVAQPRLSWIVESDRRGARQSSYRVLVAGSQQELASGSGGLWDSGRVASDETLGIEYRGRPLDSRQECWWKVRVWDENGQPSDWSTPAKWSMGLLQRTDWQAQWITDAASARNLPAERYKDGIYYPSRDPVTKAAITSQPAPMLRKEFTVTGDIRRATVYVTARGLYQLRINGRRVGDQQLAPGWTDYIRRDPAATAFKRIIIKPAVVGDLTWVKCSHQSLYGKIVSNWRREAGKLRLEVTIPPNTTATVFVPAAKSGDVTESGQPAANAKGVKFLRAEKDAAVYEVGSGTYIFEAPFPPAGGGTAIKQGGKTTKQGAVLGFLLR